MKEQFIWYWIRPDWIKGDLVEVNALLSSILGLMYGKFEKHGWMSENVGSVEN